MISPGVRWLALSLAIALSFGCGASSGDSVQRELEELKRQFAELERAKGSQELQPERPPFRYPDRSPEPAPLERTAEAPRPQPAPQPPGLGPDGLPQLPVVKLSRIETDPLKKGEPTIRIGKKGRTAPPVSAGARDRTSYDNLDPYGNVVDKEGHVVYQAGTGSPPIDTEGGELDPVDRLYEEEDPHQSPAAAVERHLAVPKVEGQRKEKKGVRELRRPRIRQVVIDDSIGDPMEQGFDRSVIVEQHVVRPAEEIPVVVEPEPEPEPVVAAPTPRMPAPRVAARPTPKSKRAPKAKTPEFSAPKPAPGPRGVIAQKPLKKSQERRAKRLYDKGMAYLNKGDLKRAQRSYKRFLKYYYQHQLADNAIYWLAETAYAKGDWLQALTWFQDVIIRYPDGNKLPDAMVKSALCYAKLGDTSYALKILSDVEALYPDKPVAGVARQRRIALGGGH